MAEQESGLGTYASDVAAGDIATGANKDDIHDGSFDFHSPKTLHDESAESNAYVKDAEVVQGAEEMSVVEIDPNKDDIGLFLKGMKKKLAKGEEPTPEEQTELDTLAWLEPDRLKSMGFSVK